VSGGAVLFVAGSLVLLLVQEESHFSEPGKAASPPFWASMRSGITTPGLFPMIGAIFAVQFGVNLVFPILPQFVQELQGSGGHVATATGLILGAAGIAGAISSISIGYFSDALGYKSVLVISSALAGILSIPQYFVGATWQLLTLRVLIGFALGAVMPAASALIAILVPPERRGTVYGLTGSATSLGFALGPLNAAVVVGIADIRSVFLLTAAVMGGIAVWVALAVGHSGWPAPGVSSSRDTSTSETADQGWERAQ
jgi:DHA1 family multidrug resistance protein-like MFS transporter